MSGEETAKPLDPFKFHHVVENDDGTIQCRFEFLRTVAALDDNGSTPVWVPKPVLRKLIEWFMFLVLLVQPK